MRPALRILTGFPGTGKLTVARALAAALERSGTTVRVVDNHWINNPIFGLVEQDGTTPLPAAVWDRVGEVAGAAIRTVEEFTPRSWHLVFTADLDGETDTAWIPRLTEVAATRKTLLVPVRLTCDPEGNARRIVAPERRAALKSVDPDEPARLAAQGRSYDSGHPHTLTLDITVLPPEEAAEQIIGHAGSLS